MEDKTINKEVSKHVEEKIETIIEQGINSNNLDTLYKLVDIHKDLSNEDYWEMKKEEIKMRYRYGENSNYGEYGESNYGARGRQRDGRGRYSARGRGGRYRGQEMLEEMNQNYGEYSEGKEEYNRGNYGAEGETIKSLEYMLESAVDFFEMLKEEASSQEEMELIKKYARKISEM